MRQLTEKQQRGLSKIGLSVNDISWHTRNDGIRERTVERTCDYCGTIFHSGLSRLENGYGNYCSKVCSATGKGEKLTVEARIHPLSWSHDLAYLVGMIASDGCMLPPWAVQVSNTDFEYMQNAVDIIHERVNPKRIVIHKEVRGDKCYYTIKANLRRLYMFLQRVGLTPRKSLTMPALDIPDKYFPDFLRGEVDGDGCISKTNKHIEISSGSREFLHWLFSKIKANVGIKKNERIYLCGDGRTGRITFDGNDMMRMCQYMYNGGPCLSRKRARYLAFAGEY